jgi:hypothetical protein|tara:strand:- start:1171 stop:1455 length:285 start_codon:yes stop_codon:yes gene_type:complete
MTLAQEILSDANATSSPRAHLMSYYSDMHKDAYGVRGTPCVIGCADLADIAEAIASFHNDVAEMIRTERAEEVAHAEAVKVATTSTEWTIAELF